MKFVVVNPPVVYYILSDFNNLIGILAAEPPNFGPDLLLAADGRDVLWKIFGVDWTKV